MAEPSADAAPSGSRVVCVGLATLDVIQYAARLPAPGEKGESEASWCGAGGPAANAAATVALLGGPATLVAPLGDDRPGELVHADLDRAGVDVESPTGLEGAPTTVSSAWVATPSGDRTVLSTNAPAGADHATWAALPDLPDDAAAVLLDGFLPRLACEVARAARRHGVPVVLDGGSWKPVHRELLPLVDHAICSARFAFPDAADAAVTDRLARLGSTVGVLAAITDGGGPIHYRLADARGGGAGEVWPPRPPQVVDTLGAGDVLHGAFAHHLTQRGHEPVEALSAAAADAAASVSRHGPRAWAEDAVSR